MAAKVTMDVTPAGDSTFWVNKKTGSRYETVKHIEGTKLVEVTTKRTPQPYIVQVDSLQLVVRKSK